MENPILRSDAEIAEFIREAQQFCQAGKFRYVSGNVRSAIEPITERLVCSAKLSGVQGRAATTFDKIEALRQNEKLRDPGMPGILHQLRLFGNVMSHNQPVIPAQARASLILLDFANTYASRYPKNSMTGSAECARLLADSRYDDMLPRIARSAAGEMADRLLRRADFHPGTQMSLWEKLQLLEEHGLADRAFTDRLRTLQRSTRSTPSDAQLSALAAEYEAALKRYVALSGARSTRSPVKPSAAGAAAKPAAKTTVSAPRGGTRKRKKRRASVLRRFLLALAAAAAAVCIIHLLAVYSGSLFA